MFILSTITMERICCLTGEDEGRGILNDDHSSASVYVMYAIYLRPINLFCFSIIFVLLTRIDDNDEIMARLDGTCPNLARVGAWVIYLRSGLQGRLVFIVISPTRIVATPEHLSSI